MYLYLLRIRTFLKSLLWHISLGLPKSSKKQILERYDICQVCDKFSKNQCMICGCNINNKSIFLNKLAWADQKCPINKW